MKKLVIVLMGILILSTGAVFADEVIVSPIDEEVQELELEEIIDEMDESADLEAVYEEEMSLTYHSFDQFKDEFRRLTEARIEGATLRAENRVKNALIKSLKFRANIRGNTHKLEVANFIEKEINVIHRINEKIIAEKADAWIAFQDLIQEGNYDDAEFTLKKIIVIKKMINENLKVIQTYLDLEITVLN